MKQMDITPINLSVFEILVHPPENERMSPEKEPFQKERLLFQPKFFQDFSVEIC